MYRIMIDVMRVLIVPSTDSRGQHKTGMEGVTLNTLSTTGGTGRGGRSPARVGQFDVSEITQAQYIIVHGAAGARPSVALDHALSGKVSLDAISNFRDSRRFLIKNRGDQDQR